MKIQHKNYKVLKKLKRKKDAWFVPIRGSWLPVSWQAWATYVPFTAYLVLTLVVGWQQSSSHAMAVLYIVPNWVAATAIMTYVAKRTS